MNEVSRAISDALQHISPGLQLLVPEMCIRCVRCVSYELLCASQTVLDAHA